MYHCERRCVYSAERARERYPFRISIRFFARHHTVFSGPATQEYRGSPAIMYCLPATCHDGASLNTVLAFPT
jgi:hypothetical protein